MRFSDIECHGRVADSLRRLVDAGRLPHAVLLHGQPGIGKMLLARALAQYVHCQHRDGGEPCGRCPDCLQHQSLNHPDMHFVYPVFKKESSKPALSVDFIDRWKEFLESYPYMETEKWPEMLGSDNKQPVIYKDESEEIMRIASLSAFSSGKKIFLIWQPEKMNVETANKLLKILEEPFADTLFILVSNAPSLILPTIFSRTSRFGVARPDDDTVCRLLVEKRGIDPALAALTARLAEGSLAKAFSTDAGEETEFRECFQELMRKAYVRDGAGVRDLTERIAAMKREKSRRFLGYAARMVRENFIYSYGVAGLNRLTPEEEAFSRRFAPFIHAGNTPRIEREISRAETDIARNANAKIVLFDLALKLMGLLRIPSPQ